MKREIWVDYSRAIACILVAVGHLLMSFETAKIVENNIYISYFIQIIYHFHVYIFFFCSGYLFQISFTKYSDKKECIKKKIVRIIDLAVPYVLFSFITYLIKIILSNEVNSVVNYSFIEILFKYPINQMWYLYALIMILIVTPAIKSSKVCNTMLVIGIVGKFITFIPGYNPLTPINYLLQNLIWFVLGMVWSYRNIILERWKQILMTFLFVLLSVIEAIYNINNVLLDAVMTLVGTIAFVEIVRWLTEKKAMMSRIWKILIKYMFQIYLLHTICAAGIRIFLLKLSITSLPLHFAFGIIFSFIAPIVCAIIAERSKIFDGFFFPSKTIKYIRNYK